MCVCVCVRVYVCDCIICAAFVSFLLNCSLSEAKISALFLSEILLDFVRYSIKDETKTTSIKAISYQLPTPRSRRLASEKKKYICASDPGT